jgi:hypothetical protein
MGALPTYTTAPHVTSTNPASEAQEIPPETVILATFDKPMDAITINGDNFLVSTQKGSHSGTVTYDHLSRTATFTPDEPFQPGESVTAQLIKGIASLWGVVMMEDYSWNFEITTSTEVETPEPGAIPAGFALRQNYPNPFNAETQIRFSISAPGHVVLKVYNMLGQGVRTLVDEDLPAGEHRAIWSGTDEQGRNLASGVYFCRLEAGEKRDMRKMILLR